MNVGFCTCCNYQVESFDDLTKCPQCGTTGVPCSYEDQRIISINLHELRLLCIWAENWQSQLARFSKNRCSLFNSYSNKKTT
jgi:hypothetical protein